MLLRNVVKLYLIVCFLLTAFPGSSQATVVTLVADASAYEVTVGGSIALTCTGQPMSDIDVVWIRYLLSSPSNVSVIYSDLKYVSTSYLPKFTVTNKLSSDSTVSSTLTISSVDSADYLYAYECLCNIYRACSSANHAFVNMTLTYIEPKTCASSSTESSHFILSLISCLILAAASVYLFLSLFSRRSLASKQGKQYARIDVALLSVVIVIGIACCLLAAVIWADPTLLWNEYYAPIFIISLILLPCALFWILSSVYIVILWKRKLFETLKLVCSIVDLVIAVLSGIALAVANVLCASYYTYSLMNVLSATCFLASSFVLSIIAFTAYQSSRSFFEFKNLKTSLLKNRSAISPAESDFDANTPQRSDLDIQPPLLNVTNLGLSRSVVSTEFTQSSRPASTLNQSPENPVSRSNLALRGHESIAETTETSGNVDELVVVQENAELIDLAASKAATVSKARIISDFFVRLSRGLDATSKRFEARAANRKSNDAKAPPPPPARRLSTVSRSSYARSEKSSSQPSAAEPRVKPRSRIWQWSSNYSNRFHKNQIDVLQRPQKWNNRSDAKSSSRERVTPASEAQVSASVSLQQQQQQQQTADLAKDVTERGGGSRALSSTQNPFHLLWQSEMNDKVHRLESE